MTEEATASVTLETRGQLKLQSTGLRWRRAAGAWRDPCCGGQGEGQAPPTANAFISRPSREMLIFGLGLQNFCRFYLVLGPHLISNAPKSRFILSLVTDPAGKCQAVTGTKPGNHNRTPRGSVAVTSSQVCAQYNA